MRRRNTTAKRKDSREVAAFFSLSATLSSPNPPVFPFPSRLP
jgi:hypothetical protein